MATGSEGINVANANMARELKTLVAMLLQHLRALSSGKPQEAHRLIELESELKTANSPEQIGTLRSDLEFALTQLDIGSKSTDMKLAGAFRTAIDALVEVLKGQVQGGSTVSRELEQSAQQLDQLAQGKPTEKLMESLKAVASGVRGSVENLRSHQKSAVSQLSASHAEIERLKGELKRRQEEAIIDELTAIYNRRAFNKRLKEEIARLARYKTPFSLIIFDIDHFKRFNDTCGHLAGDEVLRTVAEVVGKATRQTDFLARYGGEEFAIIAANTSIQSAAVVAEKVREKVAEIQFVYDGKSISVTISLGVAECATRDSSASLIKRTGACLYSAKAGGRNKVCQANGG